MYELCDLLTGCVTCRQVVLHWLYDIQWLCDLYGCMTCRQVVWLVGWLCGLCINCVTCVRQVRHVPCCQVKPQQLQQPPAPSPSVVSMQSIANPPSPAQMIIAAAQVSQYHPFQFGSAQLLTPAQEPRVCVFPVTSRYVYAVVTW